MAMHAKQFCERSAGASLEYHLEKPAQLRLRPPIYRRDHPTNRTPPLGALHGTWGLGVRFLRLYSSQWLWRYRSIIENARHVQHFNILHSNCCCCRCTTRCDRSSMKAELVGTCLPSAKALIKCGSLLELLGQHSHPVNTHCLGDAGAYVERQAEDKPLFWSQKVNFCGLLSGV